MKESVLQALAIASHLAYMVLLPLVVFGGAGLVADRYFNTLPVLLFTGVAIGLISTFLWIKNRLVRIIQTSINK